MQALTKQSFRLSAVMKHGTLFASNPRVCDLPERPAENWIQQRANGKATWIEGYRRIFDELCSVF